VKEKMAEASKIQRKILAAIGRALFAIRIHNSALIMPKAVGMSVPQTMNGNAAQITASTIAHIGFPVYALPLRRHTPLITTSGTFFSIINRASKPSKRSASSILRMCENLEGIVCSTPFIKRVAFAGK